jgi:hypothetical protein
MRKILSAFALIASLFASPAYADFSGKDAASATITFKNPGTCTSVVCTPIFAQYDSTGTNAVAVLTAGADTASNTANGSLSYNRNLLFNGTTWDRWLGDATNGGFVNVKTSVLPTGAGTSANQSTINTSLGTINTTLGTLATHADAIAAIPAQAASVIIGGVGVPSWAGGTLGAMANYGTSPGAVLVPGVNAAVIGGTVGTMADAKSTATDTTPITLMSATKQISASAQLIATSAASLVSGLLTPPVQTTLTSQYPAGAVPITASNTGTTGATTATLTNVTGHTTYICGYSVRANATAAINVTDTVTGVITATMSSILWVAPVASGIGVDEQILSPCIPASAVSTSIAVTSGAPGTGGVVSVKAWGYSL